ncbi:MAG: hypothetical protein RLZZ436_1209 [Planctomycetota bacterium]
MGRGGGSGSSGWRRLSALQRAFDWVTLDGSRRWWQQLPALDVVLEFAADWYHSRPRHLWLSAMPAVAACGFGVFVGGEAVAVSKERLIQEYEQRAEQLQQTGDRHGRELCLRALAGLDAENPAHRVRLGLLCASIGRLDAARQQMRLAAGLRESGVAEASLWLARDRLGAGLSSDSVQEAERLLLEALEISPRNAAVRLELAAFFEARGELHLAEHSLAEAAAVDPLHYPGLLQWLLRHQRPGERIQEVIREAVRALEEQLQKTPKDEVLRIALSEVHVVEGNFSAGERVLKGVDGTQDLSGAVRGAWSSLRLLQARSLLQQSPLNADAVLPLLAESLAYDPWFTEALDLAETLVAGGLRFPADALDKPLQQLREERRNDGDSVWRTIWISSRLQLLAGHVPELPEPPSPSSASAKAGPALLQRLQYAELLRRCDRKQDAEAAAEQLLSELQADPERDPGRQLTAECLLLLEQSVEALRLLQGAELAEGAGGSGPVGAAHRRLLARASVAAFDEALQRSGVETAEATGELDPVELLRPAFDDSAFVLPALERLSRLWAGDSEAAAAARSLLYRLRSEGRFTTEIASMLGVAAVQQGRYAEAVLFLREADAVVGRADAAIQNNLAVALVRADAALADEALELIDAALEQQPGHPDLLATRGEVCVALGMWLEAVECLTAALPARRGDAELQRLLEKATLSLRDQQRSDRLKRPGLRPREPAQPRQQPGTAGFGSDVPDRE